MPKPRRMNLASLRNFIAVAESGSFSEAASRLGISQPAVSLSIKHIEDECGVKLFDRSHGKCRLTEEGSFLLEYAGEVADVEDKFYAAVEEIRGEISGRFEVVSSNIPGEYVLPSIIGEFKRDYPRVELILEISDSYSVIDKIRAGEKEIGFTGVKPDNGHLVAKPFFPDTLVMIAPVDHPLAKASGITKSDLQKADYILREKNSGTRQIMLEVLEKEGIQIDRLRVAMELSSTSSVLSAVAGGAGISMTSCLAASPLLGEGKVVPLTKRGLVVNRDLYLIYHKAQALSRAAQAYIEFVEEKRLFLLNQADKALEKCQLDVLLPGLAGRA